MKGLVIAFILLVQFTVLLPDASAQSLTDAFFEREDVRNMIEQFVYFGIVVFLMAIGIFVVFMKKEKMDFSKFRQQVIY